MIKEMRSVPTARIAEDLGRDSDAVRDFRHTVQGACGEIDEISLSEVCEADEIYVTAGEKRVEKEDEEGRDRGLKKWDEGASSQTSRWLRRLSVALTDELGIWCVRRSKTWTKR